MPNALVTGATGQDGSYLCELLDARGWTVHAVSREADATAAELPASVLAHRGDLLDTAGLRELILGVRPDAIFNLAGVSSVAESWRRPELVARVVGSAVAGLLDVVLELQSETDHPVRFIQASSSEIFGRADEVPQRETTPMRPVSPYGAAKAFAHDLVRIYRDRGVFAASVILFNHESPRRPTTFVTRKITSGVAAIAAGRSERLVLGNLDAVRDWGWAPDYVDAMLRVAEAPAPDDFVVATGESHTVREFVAAAFAAAGIEDWERLVEVDAAFVRPDDAPEMRGDATRIRERLGWAPTRAFAEIVSAMVEHDRELLGAR